jgi:Transposase
MTKPLKLSSKMPDGKTTKLHPLHWCIRNRTPEGSNLSDVARHMGVKPQSLYKWMKKAEADRHFSLPAPRALQLAGYFKVPASLFRPDLPWANVHAPL